MDCRNKHIVLWVISNIIKDHTVGFQLEMQMEIRFKNVAFLTSRMFASSMIRVFPSLEHSAGHVRIPEDNL